MIPENNIEKVELMDNIDVDASYKLLPDKIQGKVDGMLALRQSITKELATQKYSYPIYSFDYGIDWESLIGKDINYVEIEIKRRIKEALLKDSRINDILNFSFESIEDELICFFDVISIYGAINIEKEVNL